MAKAASSTSAEIAATLPSELTAALLADVDRIGGVMARRIASETRSLPPSFRNIGYLRAVTSACRDALRTLLRLLHDGRGMRPGDLDRLGSMGAHQAEMGVPIEVLLSAYRLAARVVWEEVIGVAIQRATLPPATVVAITAQVLEYLDDISGAVGAAYMDTRDRLLRQRERDRDRILQRLLAGDDSIELRHLAASVDLTLRPPYHVIAMTAPALVAHGAEEEWRTRGALLAADEGDTTIILLPTRLDARITIDEVGRSAVGDAATRIRYALGPHVETLGDIAGAAQRARQSLEVGLLLDPDGTLFDDAEMGLFAVLAADRPALQRYVDRQLGPLLKSESDRDRELLATIATVVEHATIGAAATALGIHRHTVVYRLDRLRELGIDVDAPGQRNALWLALQARRLLPAP